MKGLVWGGAGAGSLEATKPKSVTAGIWRRGRWDVGNLIATLLSSLFLMCPREND